jgi:cytochrome c556
MKISLFPLSLTLAGLATLATAQAELRPIQKIMQARAGWMKAMSQNLASKNLAEVTKDAEDLSKQAAKVAENGEGERKVFNQRVADQAKAVAEAAVGGDEVVIKARLGDLKNTCADCHAKFRDK